MALRDFYRESTSSANIEFIEVSGEIYDAHRAEVFMPTIEDVKGALKTVHDPEIPVNIVDLGLIYNIEATDTKVRITMTLTTPGCGMAREIALNAKRSVIDQTKCEDVLVTVTFDPPWDQTRITEDGRKTLGMDSAQ